MIRNIIAIVSTIGIIIWMITDFYGGMFIYFLSFPYLILPIIILYVFSFFETIISTLRNGFQKNKIKVLFHSVLILFISIFNLSDAEFFKSKKVLSAILKDDLFHYNLVFRENGNVENNINGKFGYSETINGTYKIVGDTIIFIKVPYVNDFIPDRLLIDKEQNALFMYKDENGNFIREKQFLNHLEIN